MRHFYTSTLFFVFSFCAVHVYGQKDLQGNAVPTQLPGEWKLVSLNKKVTNKKRIVLSDRAIVFSTWSSVKNADAPEFFVRLGILENGWWDSQASDKSEMEVNTKGYFIIKPNQEISMVENEGTTHLFHYSITNNNLKLVEIAEDAKTGNELQLTSLFKKN